MIRKEATVCRFCSGQLPSRELPSEPTPEQSKPEHSKSDPSDPQDNLTREGGLPKFYLPNLGKLFKHSKEQSPPADRFHVPYNVRSQILEVIVRQALAGAPWREICAGPMLVNNITPQEVEAEIKKRLLSMDDSMDEQDDLTPLEQSLNKGEKQVKRLLRIADDISGSPSHSQRHNLAEELREITRQLRNALEIIKEQNDSNTLAGTILQNELDSYGTKYDALLDLVNERDKLIEKLKQQLTDDET